MPIFLANLVQWLARPRRLSLPGGMNEPGQPGVLGLFMFSTARSLLPESRYSSQGCLHVRQQIIRLLRHWCVQRTRSPLLPLKTSSSKPQAKQALKPSSAELSHCSKSYSIFAFTGCTLLHRSRLAWFLPGVSVQFVCCSAGIFQF